MSYTYLGLPYSHSDPAVRERRYRAALQATHNLLIEQKWVYCPIVHCHELAKAFKMPTDAAYWADYNRAMLERAGSLTILPLEGWQDSQGLFTEASLANELGLPIRYLTKGSP